MTPENFQYVVEATQGSARAGTFQTPHGAIHTPVFMPVGTQATVKAVTSEQLSDIGASIILSNTYHLYLRPGADLIQELGGLHKFMHWERAILTDSGGFQVFSLNGLRKIDEDGVTFRSHLDGATHRFTPETSIAIQEQLGADIIMAFDECADPSDFEYNTRAMQRTHRWAERCLAAKTRPDQALFGIVQGGVFPELRERSAAFISSLGFPGHAIGGLSVGESKEQMLAAIEVVNAVLPADKPRYLMGVGTPYDLIEGIRRGVDMFDCVLPTRLARHSAAQTLSGRMNLMNAQYARDEHPIDEACTCYACRYYSRAYLRHLIRAREMLGATLISIHNIHTLFNLAATLREAILQGNFEQTAAALLENIPPSERNKL
ncbi:MAG: tRNA guanosine(34) transglycosylase Tgt [Chloroflexi bacterium]|nr:tRNA guanosine(34) transglycosylase Tgt [Chloroflexota bacterium]